MNIIQSNIVFNSNLSYGNEPDTIVLHHAEVSTCSAYDVDSWHKQQGWAGIGYHYFVGKDGSIYTGRSENAIGAHCLNYNAHSIGICAEGNYMTDTMPIAQKQALIELGEYIRGKYNIKIVGGHKEYYATDCPGTNYPLEEIKTAIIAGETIGTPVVSAPITQNPQADNTVKTIQAQLNTLLKKGLTVDGISGSVTTEAIKQFQGDVGLSQDGIWGPATAGAVGQIYSRPIDGVAYPSYEYATRYIQFRVGSSIDGVFGNNTKINVQNWQARHGIVADGVVGAGTWSKLLDENC